MHILHAVEMSMSTTQWPACRWRTIHHYSDIYGGQFVMTAGRPVVQPISGSLNLLLRLSNVYFTLMKISFARYVVLMRAVVAYSMFRTFTDIDQHCTRLPEHRADLRTYADRPIEIQSAHEPVCLSQNALWHTSEVEIRLLVMFKANETSRIHQKI